MLGLQALQCVARQAAGDEDTGDPREAIRVKAALIVNVASGSGLDARAVARALREAGAEVAPFALGDERAAAASDCERIVVAGGDGT
ncbi:MAG: hypothetical protein M3433_02085, partial [Actinomycetota bacterium]|nr:hypothetical protein [Actinomycetota bacterium]